MTIASEAPNGADVADTDEGPTAAAPAEAPVASPAPVATPVFKEAPEAHTIGPDDTLDSIGEPYGIDGVTLYMLNQSELDRQATARGFQGGSEGGRLLFPGGVINLKRPNVGTTQQAPQASIANEIARFHTLLQAGVITDAEFAAAKAKLLS